jgi:hypothetical protein
MAERQTPEQEARKRLRAQVTGAAAAAPARGLHEGHWQLHHIALPSGPGDFTPYPAPEYVEERIPPLRELLEHLAGMPCPGHARAIAWRGLEAGQ